MERALIIGASGGIGAALVNALRVRGCEVTALSRSEDGLDITDEQNVQAQFSRLSGDYDLVFVATGALEITRYAPEKSLRQVTGQGMADQFAVNTIGPALCLKHAVPLLAKDRRAVFAALSARVGSIGDNRLGGWYAYRAAKAALNQIIHTGAIELARTHPRGICVALHPGTVATSLTARYAKGHPTVSPAEAAGNLLMVIEGLTPDDTGQFYDWRGVRIVW